MHTQIYTHIYIHTYIHPQVDRKEEERFAKEKVEREAAEAELRRGRAYMYICIYI